MLEKVIIAAIAVILMLVGLGIWAELQFSQRCSEKGGVMLRQANGLVCLVIDNVKVIK